MTLETLVSVGDNPSLGLPTVANGSIEPGTNESALSCTAVGGHPPSVARLRYRPATKPALGTAPLAS
ncbi:MAG TPA: hypothetical protein VFN25_01060 [Dokdonella sp.]|uniref:hypothetical protein n=1 Tax=Dokdonella sp. TaxID=2291710 RepID=UPI002D7F5FD8|nr:hypothetical protein [Dokdonella sp.]HET9031470.1 hypothetical protein [Dokdonella sp.]